MILNTYLTFDDNCREVFEFYRSIFGGEFETLMTFRDGPEDMNVAEEELDRIMHVSLPIGSSVLMGSDSCLGVRSTACRREQLLALVPSGEQRTCGRGLLQTVRRRRSEVANGRHVLGRILRRMHRQVRHQLAGACPMRR